MKTSKKIAVFLLFFVMLLGCASFTTAREFDEPDMAEADKASFEDVKPLPEVVEEVMPTPTPTPEPNYTILHVRATAYCPCPKCCGDYAYIRPIDEHGNVIVYTATGAVAQEGRTISVDPSVIPYGSLVEINGITYVAEDCGAAIKGNSVDIYFRSHEAAEQFGVQYLDIKVYK